MAEENKQGRRQEGGNQSNQMDNESDPFQTFLSESTIHGLQHLGKSECKARRTIWLAAMVIISVFICVHLGILTSDFMAKETNIDLEIAEARILEFPAVTVCNVNPVKKSALEAVADQNELLQQLLALDGSTAARKKRRRKRAAAYWYSFGDDGRQYYLTALTLPYFNASAYCQSMGAKLVNLTSYDLAFVLSRYLYRNRYWFDLNDIDTEGSFVMSDGSRPVWLEWASTEPTDTGVEGCASADCCCLSYLGVEDDCCESSRLFVCERRIYDSSNTEENEFTTEQSYSTSEFRLNSSALIAYSDEMPISSLATTTEGLTDSSIRVGALTSEQITPPSDVFTTDSGRPVETEETWKQTAEQTAGQTAEQTAGQTAEQTAGPGTEVTARSTPENIATEVLEPTSTETVQQSMSQATEQIMEYTTANINEQPTQSVQELHTEQITQSVQSSLSSTELPYGRTTGQSEQLTTVSPCFSKPCQNGGTCLDHAAGYSCICPADYLGDNCELDVPVPGGESPELKKAEAVIRILSALDEETKKSIGYQPTDLLFYCRYSGQPCNFTSDFQLITNPILGNCYTFNAKRDSSVSSRYLSTMSGRRHGLEIGINLGQDDFLKAAGNLAGAVVLVHSKGTMPFPEDFGTVLTPALYSSIGVRLVHINRLSAPYGDCIAENMDASHIDAYIDQYNVSYSKSGCTKTCYQRHIIESCNCAVPYYPRSGVAFGSYNVSLCDEEDEEEKACQNEVDAAFAENKLWCDCPNVCQEDIYVSSKSGSKWPTIQTMESVIDDMKKLYPSLFEADGYEPDPRLDEKILKRNFLKAAVFYVDLNHEIITEVAVYTGWQFAGDVGGMLGLWVGVSIFGVIHIFEFLVVEFWKKVQTKFYSKNKARIVPEGKKLRHETD